MDQAEITQLLGVAGGELTPEQERVMEQVYQHLRKIAHGQRLKVSGNRIDTTALVNEAWLKSQRAKNGFNDRDHFFAYCSLAMRHILFDQARRNRLVTYVDDDAALDRLPVYQQSETMLELERQLEKLRQFDARLEQVFTCKFFGDMPFDAIARVLGLSERTVFRDWQKARTMLAVAMGE